MDTGPKAHPLGDALQQPEELAPVGFIEHSHQFVVVLVGGALRLGEQFTGGVGEPHGVCAPIARVAAAQHEPTLLEVIDEADHRIAVDVHGISELLLGPAVGGRQMDQQAEVLRL